MMTSEDYLFIEIIKPETRERISLPMSTLKEKTSPCVFGASFNRLVLDFYLYLQYELEETFYRF